MAIQALNTIKKWFQTGLKPSQNQFWDTWDSFHHKLEKVPLEDVEELESILNAKAEKSELDEHKNDKAPHTELFDAKEDKSQKGVALGYAPLDEFSKIAYQYLNIVDNLTSGGTTSMLSAEQGVILQNQIDSINTLLASDNPELDTFQKIADVIEQIQSSLNKILVNDLTTGGVTKALTAEMGKLLQINKEDKSQKGVAGGYAPLNSFTKLANQYLDIVNDVVSGGSNSLLSAEQGKILQNQINGINNLLKSDNINLDTLQEIVDAIEEVQMSLSTILVNDLTTGGVTKALTAEMGKLLQNNKVDKVTGKSLISDSEITRLAGVNNTVIATDAETQISSVVTEDNKVVSRSKLFNWWENIKTKVQTITAIWNFTSGIKVNNSTGNYVYTTQLLEDMITSQLVSAGYGTYKVQYSWNTIRMFNSNGFYTQLGFISSTQNNNVNLPNKTGTVALINDFVTTAASTKDMPSLIIPNGILTTAPQNGAIERDANGILWEAHNNVRSQIMTNQDIIPILYKFSIIHYNATLGLKTSSSSVPLIDYSGLKSKLISNNMYRLNLLTMIYVSDVSDGNTVKSTSQSLSIFISLNTGWFHNIYNNTYKREIELINFFTDDVDFSIAKRGISRSLYSVLDLQGWNNNITAGSNITTFSIDKNGNVIENFVEFSTKNEDKSDYLKQLDFSFKTIGTAIFKDSNNSNGQNKPTGVTLNLRPLIIEQL